ncbi:NAD(P)/FAD-dependent oxidoreductase [Verrucomicrobiaceae bacterium N1E253]|uniref:NAD(P)/FAD-dependent oxidoreductase n=1 Tax=Oceaniferula marina TaxID=2748318 RepID=A0A851GEB0_9BACT|nr:aminoacetone oxidase family FAD-binding enzyme [Oceaniferula marina]NWK56098.1 NAD(P)/FAD-dependent oxidoreductase [Oceaniferula marina]
MDNPWNLVVVGGGAAGFFGAIHYAEQYAKKQGHSPRVLILEKSGRVLSKVKVSGGGRCNVTHDCHDPRALSSHYPRGHRSLIGPFHRWSPTDTVDWFASRGVELKTEPDGRMFPTTDNSQTIIDCLVGAARRAGVTIRCSESVTSIQLIKKDTSPRFALTTNQESKLESDAILIATGGTRLASGAKLAQSLGHALHPNVPSLFAFNIADPRIEELPGISVTDIHIRIPSAKLEASGPVLITHHGLSGPAVLKLSAWGARKLHSSDYRFSIQINWLPGIDAMTQLQQLRSTWGKRRVASHSPFDAIPKRLWRNLCTAAGIPPDCLWSQVPKPSLQQLAHELNHGEYQVTGKSTNKDEFVTCGGVKLPDINLKSMESKLTPGLYFAGEILDIDGITGGFNFQNAWTTGYLAGTAAAAQS